MDVFKLINTQTDEEIEFPSILSAIHHVDVILQGTNKTAFWRIACIGYADEHYQGYELQFGDRGLENSQFISDEPQWVIPTHHSEQLRGN